jgi:UDP-N-acetylglucosamine 4,6-dehydratase/5-epimerase
VFENKIILITGGTGSWGYELTRKLLKWKPKEIRIFSRNELAQVNMQRTFHDEASLKFIIGDVRDFQAVNEACKNTDFVFHLAALKHVPVCESQPLEAIKTNVYGTENIIRASIQQEVKKVIDVSTDKAVEPINLYGMTKAFGEKLMIQANDLSEKTRFVCIRGGNVLGTNGSVVPFFKKLISEGRDITLTSQEMTRFFLTVSQAIDLLIKASQETIGGETFVMKMRSCCIADMAQVLINNLAEENIKIKEIGIRPGEKLHEVLVSSYESKVTHYYNDNYYVILPTHPSKTLYKHYKDYPIVTFQKYQSNDNLISLPEIEMLLKQGSFLERDKFMK